MNCEIKKCNQTAYVKVTFPDEDPYILCNEHFNAVEKGIGRYYQQDNGKIEVLTLN